MESFKLKRGNSTIELQKNENLIALKSTSQKSINSAIKSFSKDSLLEDANVNLGGFQLVSVTEGTHEETLDSLRENALIDSGSHVFNTPESNVPFVPTGKITLRFKTNATESQQNEIIDKYKLQVLNSRTRTNSDDSVTKTYIVGVTKDSPNPLKVAFELQQSEIINLAEPDLATPGKLKGINIPSDDLLPEQWHLSNLGVLPDGTSLGLKKGADANVIEAWKKLNSLGSPNCIVAIIDDGFDLTHPDLSTPNKIIAPWDFETKTDNPIPKTFQPQNGDWHGTSCAGVAVGAANGKGAVGAAPDCRLMPVRWGADLSDDSIEDWFEYVTIHGASVVSCSWGAAASNFVLSTRQHEAIEDCATKGRNGLGCVIVFAAGNSNHDINKPENNTVDGFAIHPNVICVAASNSRDQKADYSNFGREISICAPSSGSGGRGILTTDVTGTYKYGSSTFYAGYDKGDYTRTFGGTSSATPLVAGICALILSANPNLKADEVKKILVKSVRKIGDLSSYKNGHSLHFGYGCVDAGNAISLINNNKISKPVEFWGPPRHQLIAELADGLLTDKAQNHIAGILEGTNQSTLKSIATWADEIKGLTPEKAKDIETKVFLTKFPKTNNWHYVDLPLDAAEYNANKYPQFVRKDDVVQMISECIQILLGKSNMFSVVNALRWLTHLVGDIHQPVHVGCGYIQNSATSAKLIFDPEFIIQNNLVESSDRGGGSLLLPNGSNLHGYWDSGLPALEKDSNFQYVEQEIVKRDELFKLPIAWASETLIQARIAYLTLKIVSTTGGAKPSYKVSWDSEENYSDRCVPIVKKQKELAASRLAFVLNSIYN